MRKPLENKQYFGSIQTSRQIRNHFCLLPLAPKEIHRNIRKKAEALRNSVDPLPILLEALRGPGGRGVAMLQRAARTTVDVVHRGCAQ